MRRIITLVAAVAAAAALAGCGPVGPTDPGGEEADPVRLLTILPSPGALRGDPARAADADELAEAFAGRPDPDVAEALRASPPEAAGVREWTAPGGRTLTAVVTVWSSHRIATQVGTDLAQRLVSDGGEAWTPRDVPASRGARRDDPRERRVALAVGPNAVYVRATGPVPDSTVVRTLARLTFQLEHAPGL